MQERVYLASAWAARRWDWFNEGRIVEPRSFCQFWRTVLLYVTIAQLLTPFRLLRRFVPSFTIPGPRIPQPVSSSAHLLLRGFARALSLLLVPLRLILKSAGGAAITSVATVGEPIAEFADRHKAGLSLFFTGLAIVYLSGMAGFLLTVALLASWFWTLIAVGSVTGGSLAIYGFVKSGVLRLMCEAALAAKHGICPPVKIVREP